MPVEVVTRGKLPEERVYEATCRHCNSLLRFKHSDAKVSFDQREGDFLSVICPVCTHPVTTDLN